MTKSEERFKWFSNTISGVIVTVIVVPLIAFGANALYDKFVFSITHESKETQKKIDNLTELILKLEKKIIHIEEENHNVNLVLDSLRNINFKSEITSWTTRQEDMDKNISLINSSILDLHKYRKADFENLADVYCKK